VLLTTQLLDAMARAGVRRFVTMGSAWQHHESRRYGPRCLYAATKQAAEAILQCYTETAGLAAITLKLFHAYGPGDRRPRLVPALVRAAARGARLPMTAGEQVVDLVFVDDVVRALLRSAELLRTGEVEGMRAFAVASGRPLTVRQVVAAFTAVTGQALDVAWGALPYTPRETFAPIAMGDPLPGWSRRVSLEEGLRRTWSATHGDEEERSHVHA
jgi:nucleoside-diphosphate-sugar epimerase